MKYYILTGMKTNTKKRNQNVFIIIILKSIQKEIYNRNKN
jgi:hypothetical protein